MRKAAFTTVFTARTSSEAEALIHRLRILGLHPAALGLTAPLAFSGTEARFPVEIPSDELDEAKRILDSPLASS